MAYNLLSRIIRDALLEENETREAFGGDMSDEEDHVSEMSENSYEGSESEEMSDLENVSLAERLLEYRARDRSTSKLRGKNGYVWTKSAPEKRSDRLLEVPPVRIPGPAGGAENFETVEQFWDILVNDDIIKIIVEHTNTQIEDVCAKILGQERNLETYHHYTNENEIRAFIGILYYAGMWKSSNVDDHELWDKKNGITFYRCVMPKMRFMFLATCLRFDDKKTRNAQDKFAPIRQVWDIFIENCRRYYQPHNYCTVNEQLLGFRGCCSFRMYIKSKPDKYGLKIITLNDATTSYMVFGIPYLGKIIPENKNESIPEYFFRTVTAPIHGSNRTVICDNWFTSIPLIERMLKEPYNLTITGTMKKNKREIPAEMKVASKNPPETKFCFTNDITLLSYSPRKNKIVLVASSNTKSTAIINDKPEIVLHYNATKGETDCFDKLCHSYTVSKKTNRWPMRVFFGILDQAAVNSRILLKCKNVNGGSEEKVTAKGCLRNLVYYLVTPYLRQRYKNVAIRKDIRAGIDGILQEDIHRRGDGSRQELQKRARCALCPRKNDKKTKDLCISCERPMCNDHRIFMCIDCKGQE